MSIAGIQSNSLFETDATSSGAATASTTSSKDSSDAAVQAFLEYARETPAQRLFSNWLGSQKMTLDDYNRLPEAAKEKLVEKFREQLEQELGGASATASSTATTGALISTLA